MSGIDTTHRAHTHDGPRYSASDRPLPPGEPRTTSRARVQLVASIIVVYGLAALAVVAPMATLTLILAVVTIGGVIWGAFQLADRRAKSWGAAWSRTGHSIRRAPPGTPR